MRHFLLILAALLVTGCGLLVNEEAGGQLASTHSKTGFLLVVPDRGALGNDRVRLAFKTISENHTAQLVFITDQDSAKYVDQALEQLEAGGAVKTVVLPLFLSRANPKFNLLTEFLNDSKQAIPIQYARAFGDSYLAIEMLANRLKQAGEADIMVVASNGAADAQKHEAMTRDINQIVDRARQDVPNGEVKTIVWPVRGAENYTELNQQAWETVRALQGQIQTQAQLIPFHMGWEMDSMMSFNNGLKYASPDGVKQFSAGDDELEWFSLWMQREVNRYTALEEGSVGIVFHAHGANFHWNQTMRDATKELAGQYAIEYAFSMGDPPSLRGAVSRLEQRGARAIVIVRVFGMESSFRSGIERLIGWDIEKPADDDMGMMSHSGHGGGHGDGMSMGAPAHRLKTTSIVVTAGGLQDNALFAEALLDRAKGVSKDPAFETVILVAHGQGGERANEAWLKLLASLAGQMKQNSGHEFRDILYQTWREDWPGKSETHIASVKEMVETAGKDGGIALIIPARTTGKGPVDEFLKGLDYRAGTGFAPHPLFPKWIEQQVHKGANTIRQSQNQTSPPTQ